jgi:hypothetical protein
VLPLVVPDLPLLLLPLPPPLLVVLRPLHIP